MKQFDILLVLGYFRSAAAYLSVISRLGKEVRIGILPTHADPSMNSKTGEAHELYMRLSVEFGAQIVELDELVQTRLMVVQQFPYPDILVQRIDAAVSASKRVGLMTLAMVGIEQHDKFLSQFNLHKVYVPSRRFMDFLLHQRKAEARYADVDAEEVGLPFARYPIFPDFSVDWLIAAPTLFSFHSETGKQDFLRTVLKLLGKIPAEEVVAYKPHNGNRPDYFAPRLHYAFAKVLLCTLGADVLPRWLSGTSWLVNKRWIERIHTCMLHLQVLRRAKPLSKLTKYSDMSLEIFLPGVRKGVIGGLSNTVWGTLYFGLPFYNCVDTVHRQGESELLDKRSDGLLDLNLRYFGVPFCRGEIEAGARGEAIVTPADRCGDVVAAIRDDLERLS